MNKYERESVEFQPVVVTRDGVTITTGVQIATSAINARPVNWVNATTLGDKIGFMVSGLSVGIYEVWVKITDSPEIPVKQAGKIQVV